MSRKNICNIKEINKIFPAARNATDCIKRRKHYYIMYLENQGGKKQPNNSRPLYPGKALKLKELRKNKTTIGLLIFQWVGKGGRKKGLAGR
jgi:hypothetical protein